MHIFLLLLLIVPAHAQASDSKHPSPVTTPVAKNADPISPIYLEEELEEIEHLPAKPCVERAKMGACIKCEYGLPINQNTGLHEKNDWLK